jgi:hypothetical protein
MTRQRRCTKDRRAKATKPLSKYTFVGKRKAARRKNEMENYYVDQYEKKYIVLFGFVLIFSIFDTLLSLEIVELGGNEINPILGSLMNKNVVLALTIKYLVTATAILIILIHKNFRILKIIKVSSVITMIFIIYFVVFVYECSSYVILASGR